MSRRHGRTGWRTGVVVSAMWLVALPVSAHSFGQVYRLPVPVWLYLYGACAALALSFVVMVFCLTGEPTRTPGEAAPGVELSGPVLPLARGVIGACAGALGVAMLALCIVSGFFGVPGAYANFSMTAFWIVFLLGVGYAVALVGDIYRPLNPWLALVELIERVWPGFVRGRYAYPGALGYMPALAFYMALVWLELMGPGTPFSLAIALALYSVVNVAGVGLIGARDWFRYGEVFSVLFGLLARMAPLAGPGGQPGWAHSPWLALRRVRIEGVSLLLFVMFMLSSTAFDGLHETAVWRRLFWVDLYANVFSLWLGSNPIAAFPALLRLYQHWQTLCLLASPFVYLGVYLLFVAGMRVAVASPLSVMCLACRFAPALLPIALAYHVSHYYTLLQTQLLKIVPLASDPFGFGWDLFATADWFARANVPDPSTVWHVQVAVIVLGHIAGVYLSHRIALAVFKTRARAAISQLPMLVLMLAFTVAGLWILAQPIAPG